MCTVSARADHSAQADGMRCGIPRCPIRFIHLSDRSSSTYFYQLQQQNHDWDHAYSGNRVYSGNSPAALEGKGRRRCAAAIDCCRKRSVFCLLSSVFCLLSSVFCLLSSVFCLLSSVFCLKNELSCQHAIAVAVLQLEQFSLFLFLILCFVSELIITSARINLQCFYSCTRPDSHIETFISS